MSEISGTVLCGASCYSKMFYLNETFSGLPQEVKDELKIMCVLFTEEVGGTIQLVYGEDGGLFFMVDHEEDDYLYDEIGSELMIRRYQREKKELLTQLETLYKVGKEAGVY